MKRKTFPTSYGFSISEMTVVMLLFSIMAATVGFVTSDNLKAWGSLHGKVFNKMMEDGHLAGTTFETICRKSSRQKYSIEDMQKSCKLYYYNDPDDENPDYYAKFYVENRILYLERGNSNSIFSILPLAENVDDIQFSQDGDAVKMKMTLEDENNTILFIHSATRHAE